jgi:dipeptidyl aminopeptidase/acylaminoacyl peptidase
MAVPPPRTLRQISVFDRQGTVVGKVGEPGLYLQPAMSPDGSRVAVMRIDPRTRKQDIWTFDVATGAATPVTNEPDPRRGPHAPIWSPDGTQVAYVATNKDLASVFQKAWDGTGKEARLYEADLGVIVILTDWSADGQFLTFHTGSAGLVMVVPLHEGGSGKKAIEWLREEYDGAQARFSPNDRYIAYLSNEIKTDTFDVYVRPFERSRPDVRPAPAAVRVSNGGALGMVSWREDGKELYYLSPDWEVMVVDVTTTPTFQAGTPRVLFKLPRPVLGNPTQWRNVSRDGQRFVFTLDAPARRPS